MKLYDDPISGNGYKARLILSLLSIPYKYVPLDILKGETRTNDFLQKNLNGRIPVLETDSGEHLAESNAILFYLAQGTPYWPTDRYSQAQVMQWMFFEQYSHEPNIATPRFWLKCKVLEDTTCNREQLAKKQEAGRAALSVMDKHLENRTFFVGDQYSIADIALYAYTHVAEEGGFNLSDYPSVETWLSRVSSHPKHVSINQWGSEHQ
ncbi:MAG: glutathione S-transferase family protein [Oceanospirillales bacterium]|nr:glutathione S-transferase family protein [Oceanospirillales bacterium]